MIKVWLSKSASPHQPDEHPKGDVIREFDGGHLAILSSTKTPLAVYAPDTWAKAFRTD
ncbi:hypothetical protein [Pseudonocardia cypriaca]|uniref:Uncharacterized protein n=1 Tax=Pseudonocardia cypriaca TaxID=882449 RepID=A0A543GIN3_9PSEU|nr:hypothetical protein [Pseudonocardia cypriaca]TQM45943.1 hypothetical protein FB388_3344 [Pseudonocardia cypriaca]